MLASSFVRGPEPFCTSVKALKSDQAVRGANASCFGSSYASMALGSREPVSWQSRSKRP